jgi:hypothetical protein
MSERRGQWEMPNLTKHHAMTYGGVEVRLDNQMIGVRILAGAGIFSLQHRVQTGSRAHPASYPMVTKGWG